MKLRITFFLVLFVFSAIAQEVLWVNDTTTTTDQIIPKKSISYENYYYVGGDFKGDIDIGDDHYLSYGNKDIFLSKISSDGTYVKSIQIGGVNLDIIYDMSVYNNGDIIITGGFSSPCNFGSIILTPKGSYDGFIAKYDSDLNLIWAKNLAYSSTLQYFSAIKIDNYNNIIASGSFKDSLILGSTTIPDTITSNKLKALFIAKFNTNGDIINSVIYQSTNNACAINNIAINDDDYVFTGKFTDSLFYYSDTLISMGSSDGYIMSIDNSLNLNWMRTLKGTDSDIGYTINVNDNSDIIVGSYYSSTDLIIDSTDTDVSTITPVNNGNSDILLTSYFPNGDLNWIKYAGSIGGDAFFNASYENNILFYSGYYGGELIYDTDTFENPFNSTDALYLVIDANNGDYIDQRTVVGPGTEKGYTIDVNAFGLNNEFYLTGTFDSDTVFIGQDTVVNSDINANKTDMFVVKYGCRQDIVLDYDSIITTCPGGSNGVLQILPSDTSTIWTYEWVGQNATGQTVDSLGNLVDTEWYYTTITSPKGCAYNDSIEMTHKPALQASLIDTLTIDCAAGSDGIAAIIPSAGNITGDTLTSDYSYLWNDGITDSMRIDLAVGQYIVTISDLCADTTEIIDTINVGHLPTLQAHIETQNVIVLCDTSSNGIGRVNYSLGKAPYSFYWENSSTDTTSEVANDLTIGWHMVTITDYCNVPIIDSVNIVNMPSLGSQITFTQNASCSGINNGVATATAFNGVEPYTYAWSASDSTTASVNDLPGDSLVYVTVSDLCHDITDSVLIGLNPMIEVGFTNITNTNCATTNDGSAEVVLLNEQGTVTYLWSNDSTEALNTSLDSGYAYVTVTDICGPVVDSTYIDVEQALSVFATSQDNACHGDSLASISLTTSNEFGTVEYIWSGLSDTTSSIDSLAAGSYYYTVTDACNDTIRDSVVVISPEELKDSVVIVNETSFGEADGSATLIITGGTSPYLVAWDNNNVGVSNEYLTMGTYHYAIRDANNCELTDSVVIEADEYEVVIYNAFTPNGDGTNDVWNIKYIDRFPDATVKIFNQWGAEVFSSTDGYAEPWDGTMEGNELPAGTYYYIINLGGDYLDKTGSVTIIK